MGLHANQYIPLNPIYFDKPSSIICPCYNLLRFNPGIEKCEFKQENEQCTEKFQAQHQDSINSKIFDNSHRSTWDFKESFHAQQLSKEEATKVDLEKNNCAFTSNQYKVETLDEKPKKSLVRSEHVDIDKDLEKGERKLCTELF